MRKDKQLNTFWISHLIHTTNFLDLVFPQRAYEIKGYSEKNQRGYVRGINNYNIQ